MTATLSASAYGKNGIRLLCVSPGSSGEEVAEAEVRVLVRGGAEESFLLGDNRRVVTTDAQRNLVTETLGSTGVRVVEHAAGAVAKAMCHHYPFLGEVEVDVVTTAWQPVGTAGAGSPAFSRRGDERDRARVSTNAGTTQAVSGWTGPTLLLTRGSRFVGFVTDDRTPNQTTEDRAIAGDLCAEWVLAGDSSDPDVVGVRAAIRSTLLEAFGRRRSESVQHLLTLMCSQIFAEVPGVAQASVRLESTPLLKELDLRSPSGGSSHQSTYLMGGQSRAETWVAMQRAEPEHDL